MKIQIKRLLGDKYFEECQQIFNLRKKHSGTTPITQENFKNKFDKYFKKNNQFFVFGYFEDNKLTSWLSFILHETQKNDKFYVITNLFTTKFRTFFSMNNDEIGKLWKKMTKFSESKGYYNYYYCVSEKINRVYETQTKKSHHYTNRYDMINILVIPPNTKPNSTFYWKLMGEETKPHSIIIKKRILKEEFRKIN
jgi:hypothetical protein